MKPSKLFVQTLETRESPAILGAIDGFVLFPDDSGFRPFEGYRGPIDTSMHGTRWAISAGKSGGPVVRTSEGSQFFVFEPSFRGGVNVSRESDLIAVGAAQGGGPVVATYAPDGTQIARWFVHDPNLRGGVDVYVRDGFVYTVGGRGAGPRVDCWTSDGTLVSSFFGADHDSRLGWSLLVADGTNDGVPDFILTDPTGLVSINDGPTRGRAVTQSNGPYVGHDGTVMTYGDEYLRGRQFWNGLREMLGYQEEDGAAGNPNPPPTTGFRPGSYRPVGDLPASGDFDSLSDFSIFVGPGDPVQTSNARGTYYTPMGGKLVTARHIASRDPYAPVSALPALASPSAPEYVGDAVRASLIQPGVPYNVDAVAYEPRPGVLVGPGFPEVSLGTEPTGTPLYSIGRGNQFGLGRLVEYQLSPLFVNWGDAGLLEIYGQILAEGYGGLALLIPGFSGGPVWTMVFSSAGTPPVPTLIGMGIAGREPTGPRDPGFAIITPAHLISESLGLSYGN